MKLFKFLAHALGILFGKNTIIDYQLVMLPNKLLLCAVAAFYSANLAKQYQPDTDW